MLVVLNLHLDKGIATLPARSFCLGVSSLGTRALSLTVDDERVVAMGFDCDVVHIRTRNVAVEVIVMGIFFEIEARDEAVHEAVTAGEMAVKFIDVV